MSEGVDGGEGVDDGWCLWLILIVFSLFEFESEFFDFHVFFRNFPYVIWLVFENAVRLLFYIIGMLEDFPIWRYD